MHDPRFQGICLIVFLVLRDLFLETLLDTTLVIDLWNHKVKQNFDKWKHLLLMGNPVGESSELTFLFFTFRGTTVTMYRLPWRQVYWIRKTSRNGKSYWQGGPDLASSATYTFDFCKNVMWAWEERLMPKRLSDESMDDRWKVDSDAPIDSDDSCSEDVDVED